MPAGDAQGRGFTDYQAHQPPPVTSRALKTALPEWVVVEQAVGVLVQTGGFTADYAVDVLFDEAQDWGRTVLEQAAFILDTTPSN